MTYQRELFITTQVNITVSVNQLVYPLTESSSVCISSLEEYDNYTVSIRAVNGAGEGDPAMITVLTLEAGLYISYCLNCGAVCNCRSGALANTRNWNTISV